jgi:ornithine cyclodeaminase
MEAQGYSVQTTLDSSEVGPDCGIIIMATPAKEPLLLDDQVPPGTHITAMGSDTQEKQEVDPQILHRADLVVVDSMEQCRSRGEVFQAMKANLFEESDMVELGNVIAGRDEGRSSAEQITVADLTGVAVQDIQISKAVYEAVRHQ